MNVRSRLARVAAVLAVVSLVALSPTPAHAEEYVTITGSGSTWSENALAQWRKNVASNYGMTINYSASGSSAGRSEFIKQTVDFAVSEIPFQTESTPDNPTPESGMPPYKYMPIVAGGTSLMYNLKIGGKRVTNLRLSGEVIAKIFSGQISKWNDAAIQADNPALAMPDRDITPVYRSDGSGTSAQFTLWMSKQFGTIWTQGMRSQFPQVNASFKGQSGSLGVAGYVSQDYGEGAITYVEYSYAMKSGFPVAKVLNNAGYYVEPTFQSVAVALMSAGINADLTQNLDGVYNSGDPRSYPMSSYSYMIVPTALNKTFTEKKGKTLGKFISYMLCEGQQQASALGYSPLPMNLVQAGSDVMSSIPGSGGGIDFSACNNPTFKAGDSPSNNQLAATAPNPPDCDKRGPTQCVEGTGGAQEATDATGSGGVSGGASSADAGAGTTTTTDPAAAAGAQAAGSEPVYDANGNLVSGGGAVNAATSLPFTIAEGGWGPQAYVMLAAALLLVGAILVPPLVLRRRGSGARH